MRPSGGTTRSNPVPARLRAGSPTALLGDEWAAVGEHATDRADRILSSVGPAEPFDRYVETPTGPADARGADAMSNAV